MGGGGWLTSVGPSDAIGWVSGAGHQRKGTPEKNESFKWITANWEKGLKLKKNDVGKNPHHTKG